MKRGVLLCDDLIDGSRVTATARAVGGEMTQVNSAERLAGLTADVIIIDLATAGADLSGLKASLPAGAKLIAYGPHVSAGLLKSARELGFDPVMPRSQFFGELERHLEEWLSEG